MRDYLLMMLFVLPAIVIAVKSKSGCNAGFYVFYLWMAGACIYSLLGLLHFVFGIAIFALIAFVFREKLEINKWLSKKIGGN
ncbi:hypothetical protein [Undibacterium flavidum]|uniref:Uncharacterized protein n=1 Tax=Undibacterium flavidum TaxID=2762297 RepID=A0ABR6YAY0_9BURK|nr:hypothetical protein [Undibacterium flavidum]MBC3873743.1 hypothetical protein [Undibacterium flavidum]